MIWSNAKRLINILKVDYSTKDTIIINECSVPEYLYYKKYYKFKSQKEIFIKLEYLDPEEFKNELNKITNKNQKYWFFFSCDWTGGYRMKKRLKEWKEQYKTLFEEEQALTSYILYLQK